MADTGHPSVVLPLEMASLVESARRALRGDTGAVTQQIIDVGSSAGGARAKAVVGWHPTSNVVVSGQFELPEGFEHWILKFDVGADRRLGHTAGFGRIEYAHARMAAAAGITMSACRLLEENGRAHFMTRRFDRDGNARIHMQSLCGLAHLDFNLPFVHSYEQYLRTILQLNLGAEALAQAWRRMVFNVAAVNCDDHTKNLAFLLDRAGRWTLAPAFDMCFAHNPGIDRWTRQHQMLVRGKAWDITGGDLLAIAADFDISQPQAAMARIVDAVRRWPEFAAEAGVPRDSIERIGALQATACARLLPPATASGRAR
jgi:serine/threonine-protein kinase HipA